MISHEPFTPTTTGLMTGYVSESGTRYTFEKPFPMVAKGRAYIMELDDAKNTLKIMMVILPDPSIR